MKKALPDLIQAIMQRYQNFDLNVDCDPSILSLNYLDFEQPDEEGRIISPDSNLVIVLVESRLLDPLPNSPDLISRLLRLKGDLRAEGSFTRFIRANVYRGPRHQDGRTLLAIREFLKDVKSSYRNFLGVLLIGAFPEASLVRRCIWKPPWSGGDIDGVATIGNDFLWINPEQIAARAEIVLADLNGNWNSLYHEGPEEIEWISAKPDESTSATEWPVDGAIFSSTTFSIKRISFRDFFWIDDSDFVVLREETSPSSPRRMRILIRHQLRHPEISVADRGVRNPIAHPNIDVSRINALQVAINPNPAIQGDDRRRPLDENGYPQVFTSSRAISTDYTMFRRDRLLERKLLCDYFDRNHRFRTGAYDYLPFRVGSIAYEFSALDYATYLHGASDSFQSPLVMDNAKLSDYVNWFKQPAVLRYIMAHSNTIDSIFDSNYNVADLERAAGGPPFRWQQIGNEYRPSFQEQGGAANLYLHRTIWQNQMLRDAGANLIIHGGCEVIIPAGTGDVPYYQEGYATLPNGEGILFYMNGVAIMARAKGFFDRPEGFPGAFRFSPRVQFGDGWKAYFDNDGNNPELRTFAKAIDCKKSYFWSIIGDWTVRLRYSEGLGILGFPNEEEAGSQFQSLHIHPNKAWIDGWNFITNYNTIHAIGDIDGDRRAEFIIRSDWGIGVLKHDGTTWRQITASPNDTWFGGWRYTSSDIIEKIGNFANSTNKKEILLTSSWGIGILSLIGGRLISTVAQPNGTRFGQWVFDSRSNRIIGIGDINGDNIDEIIMTSEWGIGVLSVNGNTLNSLVASPNGTRFGLWVLDSLKNEIRCISDLDGDGRAEILMTSNDGLGIIKLKGSQLESIVVHSNGTNLGGYTLNTRTLIVVVAAAAFDSSDDNRRSQLILADGDGLHILQLENNSLRQTVGLRNGEQIDGWMLDTSDNVFGPIGDLDGDGRSEVIVRSHQGLGVMKLQGNTFRCVTLHQLNTRIGDWFFERNDRIIGLGSFNGSPVGKMQLLVQKGI
jgi:hypothetical protein